MSLICLIFIASQKGPVHNGKKTECVAMVTKLCTLRHGEGNVSFSKKGHTQCNTMQFWRHLWKNLLLLPFRASRLDFHEFLSFFFCFVCFLSIFFLFFFFVFHKRGWLDLLKISSTKCRIVSVNDVSETMLLNREDKIKYVYGLLTNTYFSKYKSIPSVEDENCDGTP